MISVVCTALGVLDSRVPLSRLRFQNSFFADIISVVYTIRTWLRSDESTLLLEFVFAGMIKSGMHYEDLVTD